MECWRGLWEGRPSVIDTQNFTIEARKPYYHDTVQASSTISSLLKSYETGSGPMNCSPLGYSSMGILQASILGWVAMSSSRGSSQSRDQTQVYRIAGGFFTI